MGPFQLLAGQKDLPVFLVLFHPFLMILGLQLFVIMHEHLVLFLFGLFYQIKTLVLQARFIVVDFYYHDLIFQRMDSCLLKELPVLADENLLRILDL